MVKIGACDLAQENYTLCWWIPAELAKWETMVLCGVLYCEDNNKPGWKVGGWEMEQDR